MIPVKVPDSGFTASQQFDGLAPQHGDLPRKLNQGLPDPYVTATEWNSRT